MPFHVLRSYWINFVGGTFCHIVLNDRKSNICILCPRNQHFASVSRHESGSENFLNKCAISMLNKRWIYHLNFRFLMKWFISLMLFLSRAQIIYANVTVNFSIIELWNVDVLFTPIGRCSAKVLAELIFIEKMKGFISK